MKFQVSKTGGRILTAKPKELYCNSCKTYDTKQWYFFEGDKKLYCEKCSQEGHINIFQNDWSALWLIDEVKID